MCKRFLLLVSVVFFFSGLLNSLFAQSIESIKADRETYIWGEGTGSTVKGADQAALAEIIGQISTQVESSTEGKTTESNNEFKKTWSDVVKTYSNATLKNTERVVVQNEPDAIVFRYVKRSELAKIFESRKNKIIELAQNAVTAEKNLQIADALRYFYWSQTLLRSHPEASEIKMKSENGNDELLITWIPMQINRIFANLSVKIEEIEEKDNYANYILDIKYNSEPVRNYDYTYWDGQDWSNIISAKDGIGAIELPKTQIGNEIRLKSEYVFDGEANIDMELRDVMQKLPEVPYKNSYMNIGSKPSTPSEKSSVAESNSTAVSNVAPATNSISQVTPANSINNLGSVHALTEVADKETIMKKIVTSISTKNYTAVEPLFTPEGYTMFQELLQYGHAKILKNVDLKYYKSGDFVICRSIPMSFSFKSNNRTFVEDVVFYFDKENKISNITFGLSKKSVDDIGSNVTWSEEVRMQLINFMENYKTAYALKRLDYIEKIFSDDALIITGSVTKVNNSPEFQYSNNSIVKYNRQTKAEYLRKLKYSFASNEFINLRFADNIVKRSGKANAANVYGIQIKQDYFSTNYGDTGYLFLLIDFTDSIAPQIHVRTWQPEKNADGSIYGLSDF
jgi:hypothetical protein